MTTTKLIDMQVELMDHMGNDDSIVNAARVSFNKSAEGYTPEENAKLIRYLAKHKHDIPFAHTAITLRVKAPISIRTQCFKHKVGFVENEVSRRYVKEDVNFFDVLFREKPEGSIKQGSGGDFTDRYFITVVNESDELTTIVKPTQQEAEVALKEMHEKDASIEVIDSGESSQGTLQYDYQLIMTMCHGLYKHMINVGVAPEQARFVLPQGAMTEWVWTGSLLAFARFYNLRKKPNAQKEVKDLALLVGDIIAPLYPVAWEALTKEED